MIMKDIVTHTHIMHLIIFSYLVYFFFVYILFILYLVLFILNIQFNYRQVNRDQEAQVGRKVAYGYNLADGQIGQKTNYTKSWKIYKG